MMLRRLLLAATLALASVAAAPGASAHYCSSNVDECGPCDSAGLYHVHIEAAHYRCASAGGIEESGGATGWLGEVARAWLSGWLATPLISQSH